MTKPSKAEWVATMLLIKQHDPDTYRRLRKEAWDRVIALAPIVPPSEAN